MERVGGGERKGEGSGSWRKRERIERERVIER